MEEPYNLAAGRTYTLVGANAVNAVAAAPQPAAVSIPSKFECSFFFNKKVYMKRLFTMGINLYFFIWQSIKQIKANYNEKYP